MNENIFSKKEQKKKNFILMNGLTNLTDSQRDKFKIDQEGLFSITSADIAKDIAACIVKLMPNKYKISITDATASVGGNSLTFLLHPYFKFINMIELDQLRFTYLKENIKLIENNIKESKIYKTYNESYLDIMMDLEEDIIFIDPPWGGPSYYKRKTVDLYLDEIPLYTICNKLFTKKKLKFIILKCPNNFGLSKFAMNLEKDLEIKSLRNLHHLRKMKIFYIYKK